MSETILEIQNLKRSYGRIQAVDGVDFKVKTGSLTILAGADGAGKSTLLKMILGLVRADSGRILLDGSPLEKDFTRLTAVTGYMPERFSLYSDLSVEENLNFFADIHRVPRRRREELKLRLLETTGMLPFRKRAAGDLSGGMKQKLALSAILLSSPRLILLDEPTTGVDPLSRIEFFRIIEDLTHEGRTVIVSTPYLDEAEKGDEIIFLKQGRILRRGSIQNLKREFPARLYRILPEGGVFEQLQRIRKNPQIRDDVFIRGRYLKYMKRGSVLPEELAPAREILEVAPTLEDVYLYYERSDRHAEDAPD